MERLVYSPEVFAYIYTAAGSYIDITNDIIDGTLTRNVNQVSNVSFRIQNRYTTAGQPIYMGKIMPMDRIVVYLKKTKPILVFSGYIDLVPFYQPMPKPITIEASCTLKRLEFTYWDPGLESVYTKLNQLGFVYNPSTGSGYLPDTVVAGSRRVIGEKELNDTGFAALLRFLLIDVGQWKDEAVYIEPLPEGWIARVAGIYQQVLKESEQLQSYLTDFLDSMFNSGGGSDANGDGIGGSSVFNGDMVQHLTSYLQSKKCPWPSEWARAADAAGKKYNLDPRLLIAINGSEHAFGVGKYQDLVEKKHNPFGMGGPVTSTGITYSSWTAGFNAAAKNIAENYVKEGLKTITAIGGKWAPIGASNDPNNLNANWPKNVKKFYAEVGGNPEASDGFPYPAGDIVSGAVESTTDSISNLTGAAQDGRMTVEIQAGHTEPRQRGYEGQTGYPGEITFNLQNQAQMSALLTGEAKNYYKELTYYATRTGSSPERDYDGDIYIILHGDNKLYAGKRGGISYPGPWSKNSEGISAPNSYVSSGEKEPYKAVRSVANDSALSSNSRKLVEYINKHVNSLTDNTLDVDTSNGRMCNNYAFYYNKSQASVIIEIPQIIHPKLFQAIADGILDYKRNAKTQSVKNSPPANSSAPAAPEGPSATKQENSNAKKLIDVLVKYAQNHPETSYELGGQRGIPLSAVDPKGSMDCSGFVGNGMIEIGVEGKGFSPTTVTLAAESKMVLPLGKASADKLKPGMFIIDPDPGGAGHMLVYIGDNKVVHCSSGKDGPNVQEYTSAWPGYGGYIHPKVGTTSQVVTGGESLSNTDGVTSNDVAAAAKRAAFNVFFNFPVNIIESTFLTGYRSFENDVKLLETIEEITKASMRVFSSLPDGGFIAWYPDYFNISGRNPWFRISTNEIIDCTIDLSDKYLTTHVYLTGNPWGPASPSDNSEGGAMLEKLFGSGVATIEQPYILDSFLRPPIEVKDVKKRPESLVETQGAVYKFLSKYGVRPYNEKQMTLRHPAVEFFYAYHKFMELWAKQFVSRIELTFQPEIFPGMIVELEEKDGPGFACYVDQVVHSFSYTGGFTTQINAMALSRLYESGNKKISNVNTSSIHPSLALITRSAAPLKLRPAAKKPAATKPKVTPKRKISSKGINSTGGTPRINRVEQDPQHGGRF